MQEVLLAEVLLVNRNLAGLFVLLPALAVGLTPRYRALDHPKLFPILFKNRGLFLRHLEFMFGLNWRVVVFCGSGDRLRFIRVAQQRCRGAQPQPRLQIPCLWPRPLQSADLLLEISVAGV